MNEQKTFSVKKNRKGEGQKMEVIKKKVIVPNFGNKKMLLLGIRNNGQKIYLEQGSFDCSWYYGFGYLEVLNRNHTDIKEHYHLNSYNKETNLYDGIKANFKALVLNDSELWEFCDLMKMFYILKDSNELYKNGKANYTSHDLNIKSKTMVKKILKDTQKTIKKVHLLLGMEDKDNIILNDEEVKK